MAGRLSSSKLATPSRIPTALRFSATPRSGIPVARSRAKYVRQVFFLRAERISMRNVKIFKLIAFSVCLFDFECCVRKKFSLKR